MVDREGSPGSAGAVAVVGAPDLFADVMCRILAAAGFAAARVLSTIPSGCPGTTVLLSDDDASWDVARRLGAPVVLVRPQEQRSGVVNAVLRGADAVLGSGATPDEVVEAVRVAMAGGTLVDPLEAREVAEAARRREAGGARSGANPTARELDILASIGRGHSVKQTATSLGISAKTVENLQSRLYKKLDVRNRAQAVSAAHDRGLLAVDRQG
ncbi:MAG: response regulator transcription factor [Actinomycetota bacterium]